LFPIPLVFPFTIGIIAIVFNAGTLIKFKKNETKQIGRAVSGLILGVISVMPGLILAAALVASFIISPANVSSKNLIFINKACLRYAQDNNNRYPDSIDTLIKNGYIKSSDNHLSSPFAFSEYDGYSITSGLNTHSPSNSVLIKELYPDSKGKKAIFYINGTIDRIDNP
jgi:hypothetical protein